MNVWAVNTPIRPSRKQQIMVCLLHTLAVVAIWVAYMPILAKAVATLLLVFMLVLNWRQLNLQLPNSIVALAADESHWTISLNDGQHLRLQLQTWAVWRYLIVLDFRATDVKANYRVIIWPDSIKQADYRRLQVRLRLKETRQKLPLLQETHFL